MIGCTPIRDHQQGDNMKQTAQDILTDQLKHIQQKAANERKSWELKLVLDIWRACEQEIYHNKITDLSGIPDEDIDEMARRTVKNGRK